MRGGMDVEDSLKKETGERNDQEKSEPPSRHRKGTKPRGQRIQDQSETKWELTVARRGEEGCECKQRSCGWVKKRKEFQSASGVKAGKMNDALHRKARGSRTAPTGTGGRKQKAERARMEANLASGKVE